MGNDFLAQMKRAEFLDFKDNHKEELEHEFLRNFDFDDSDEFEVFCLNEFKVRDD